MTISVERAMDRADESLTLFAVAHQKLPKSPRQFELHAGAGASAVANIVGVAAGEGMAVAEDLRHDANTVECGDDGVA